VNTKLFDILLRKSVSIVDKLSRLMLVLAKVFEHIN